MKTFLPTLVVTTLVLSSPAFAENITVPSPSSNYGQDARSIIARDSYGECWRSTFWKSADAVTGCDGAAPKAAVTAPAPVFAAAPTPVVAPAPAPVAAAPAPVAAPAPAATPAKPIEKVNLAADALFDSGKSDLKPAGKAKLDDLAAKLKSFDLDKIVATGHTDSVGSTKFNQKLSVKRADTVKTYLVSKGADGSRIQVEGKGKTKPIANNKTAAGRAQNRRVEIEIFGSRVK